MPTRHLVKQGECLAAIARTYGLPSWRSLYEANPDLKAAARNPNILYHPNILYPGEEILIPDRVLRHYEGETEKKHRFQLRTERRNLHLRLVDERGTPLANTPYRLEIDGVLVSDPDDATDAEGYLRHPISPRAERGLLTTDDYAWALTIATLDPAERSMPDDGLSGVAGRLQNLGFLDDPRDANAVRNALMSFQHKAGLPLTGEVDDRTRDALVRRHGA